MPIVTDGLVGYWNSKQGVNGAVWENIAPATVGTLNGTIVGAVVETDGMYFDGVDDSVDFNTSLGLVGDYTIEIMVKVSGTSPAPTGFLVMGSSAVAGGLASRGTTLKLRAYPSNLANDTVKTYANNLLHHFVVRYNATEDRQDLYVNNVLDASFTDSSPTVKATWNYTSWAFGRRPATTGNFFKGHIPVVRFYNRILTPVEITQNNASATEVGLSETPPSAPPVVKSMVASRAKISDEPNVNQSIITVRFDSDVTQYVARLNGVDYATGTLVHTGGAVAANTDATVVIDWNELATEGSNRINVYGQNANGWTTIT